MSPDLSNLKLVEEDIQIADDATYADATGFPPPIPEGTYTFIQGKPEFAATDKGYLSANMTQTVASGEFEGRTLNFDRVSAKPFQRQGVNVSMMTDHLRAVYPVGAPERSARTNQDKAAAIEAAEGKAFKAVVKWDGYCKHAETEQEGKPAFTVNGARNFPANGNGKPAESMTCPTCGKAVEARARVDRRIPQ